MANSWSKPQTKMQNGCLSDSRDRPGQCSNSICILPQGWAPGAGFWQRFVVNLIRPEGGILLRRGQGPPRPRGPPDPKIGDFWPAQKPCVKNTSVACPLKPELPRKLVQTLSKTYLGGTRHRFQIGFEQVFWSKLSQTLTQTLSQQISRKSSLSVAGTS